MLELLGAVEPADRDPLLRGVSAIAARLPSDVFQLPVAVEGLSGLL